MKRNLSFCARLSSRPIETIQESMKTRNLHAKSDFEKGDQGHVQGHAVVKVDPSERRLGIATATALQEVRAGANGWFEIEAG